MHCDRSTYGPARSARIVIGLERSVTPNTADRQTHGVLGHRRVCRVRSFLSEDEKRCGFWCRSVTLFFAVRDGVSDVVRGRGVRLRQVGRDGSTGPEASSTRSHRKRRDTSRSRDRLDARVLRLRHDLGLVEVGAAWAGSWRVRRRAWRGSRRGRSGRGRTLCSVRAAMHRCGRRSAVRSLDARSRGLGPDVTVGGAGALRRAGPRPVPRRHALVVVWGRARAGVWTVARWRRA